MQNGKAKSEYQSIAAQYAKAKAQREQELAQRPQQTKSTYSTKLEEARFTATQGLLIAFLTLILYTVSSRPY
jgi:hypothetical protein